MAAGALNLARQDGRTEDPPKAARSSAGKQPGGSSGRLRRALSFAFPYRRAVLGILVITIFLAAINAAEPLILKYVFDGLTTAGKSRILLVGVVWLVGLSILREIATGYSNWQTWHARLG